MLVSKKSGSVWPGWLLADRGWTIRSVWWAKNMSGPGPLLESSEWLSVSNRERLDKHRFAPHYTIFMTITEACSTLQVHASLRKHQVPQVYFVHVCVFIYFYLCCCRPHYPGSLVLCVEGWMESCSFLMMYHQRYLDQNLHLQQHLFVKLQTCHQTSGYRAFT